MEASWDHFWAGRRNAPNRVSAASRDHCLGWVLSCISLLWTMAGIVVLPLYSTKEELEQKLRVALDMGDAGFGNF